MEQELIAEIVGRRLRDLRRSVGLTMAEVARASAGRWQTSSIGNYERGTRSMGLSAIEWFAEYYGVTLSYLLDGEREPRSAPPIRVTLDLGAMAHVPEAAPAVAVGSQIAAWRGVSQTERITVRVSDLPVLAAALDTSIDAAIRLLTAWGAECRPAGPVPLANEISSQ